ncbi:MAG: O-antigen ligase [Tissierellia bacterium]|nr:O-antigen ligase [Tissierellia bacterium]
MGLEAAEVGLFVILVDFVLIIFVASYFYYKKIINPISVYLIFVTMFLYSTLPLSKSIEFSDKLLFFILTAIFTYFLGVFIPRPKRIMTFPLFSEKTRVLYFRILSAISIASFLFEVMIMGYIPILRIFDSLNIYGDATESMTILHTFVLLAPILVFWCLILYKDGTIGKRERNLFLLLFIFLIINNFGRTTLLMFFITGLIYLEFYGKLNNKKLVTGIIAFLVVFIVMGNIRTGSTGDNIKRVLRNIANTEYETSMFESYLISYSSVNFYKMNDIVELRDEIGGYSYGANALKPLMKLIGYSPDILKKNPIFDSQGRLTTYLIDPYIDFGLIGIIIFNLLYGMVSGTLFRKYNENRSPEYIISWSIIVFCLFMGFFYNAFNTMVVWLVYVSNKIILKRI